MAVGRERLSTGSRTARDVRRDLLSGDGRQVTWTQACAADVTQEAPSTGPRVVTARIGSVVLGAEGLAGQVVPHSPFLSLPHTRPSCSQGRRRHFTCH